MAQWPFLFSNLSYVIKIISILPVCIYLVNVLNISDLFPMILAYLPDVE